MEDNRPPWYLELEALENRQRFFYNDRIHRNDRLFKASNDFMSLSRLLNWPYAKREEFESLIDPFREYIGVVGGGYNHRKLKRKGHYPHDDVEANLNPRAEQRDRRQFAVRVAERGPRRQRQPTDDLRQRYEECPWADTYRRSDDHMDFFFEDPSYSMNIFFSSYLRDKDIAWAANPTKVTHVPLAVQSFFTFLRKNYALEGFEEELESAINVAKRAEVELSIAKRMAMTLPDLLGRTCAHIWGKSERPYNCAITPFPMSNLLTINGHEELPIDTYIIDERSGGWQPEDSSFTALLSSPTFLLLYTRGYVESSTRKIMTWVIPPTQSDNEENGVKSNSESDLDILSRCAQVVLAPWVLDGQWDTRSTAYVQKPELIRSPDELATIPRHDSEKDNIILLVDPKATKDFRAGFGIGGIFVQMIPTGDGIQFHQSGDNSKTWWYVEKMEHVLPSFHVERAIPLPEQ